MTFDADFNRLLVGNLTYVLLVISMMMTRMLWLRVVAISAGATGVIYAVFWLSDPVITFWESVFTLVNVVQILLIMYRHYFARFSEEERMFYDEIVPKLEPRQALGSLWVSGGATCKWNEQFSLDFAYTHIFVSNALINISPGVGNPVFDPRLGTFIGNSSGAVDIVSLGLRYHFSPLAPTIIRKG